MASSGQCCWSPASPVHPKTPSVTIQWIGNGIHSFGCEFEKGLDSHQN